MCVCVCVCIDFAATVGYRCLLPCDLRLWQPEPETLSPRLPTERYREPAVLHAYAQWFQRAITQKCVDQCISRDRDECFRRLATLRLVRVCYHHGAMYCPEVTISDYTNVTDMSDYIDLVKEAYHGARLEEIRSAGCGDCDGCRGEAWERHCDDDPEATYQGEDLVSESALDEAIRRISPPRFIDIDDEETIEYNVYGKIELNGTIYKGMLIDPLSRVRAYSPAGDYLKSPEEQKRHCYKAALEELSSRDRDDEPIVAQHCRVDQDLQMRVIYDSPCEFPHCQPCARLRLKDWKRLTSSSRYFSPKVRRSSDINSVDVPAAKRAKTSNSIVVLPSPCAK